MINDDGIGDDSAADDDGNDDDDIKFAIFDFVYTLVSANIDQSVPNLAIIYLPIRSRMSSIMEQIKPEHPELFALEFGKVAEADLVYTLASPNINKSAPNLVKMYVTIRSRFNRSRTVRVICT